MEKTVHVEGMACPKCEAKVKKALEALEQVDEAVVSRETCTAVCKLNADVDNDTLANAVKENTKFTVTGVD